MVISITMPNDTPKYEKLSGDDENGIAVTTAVAFSEDKNNVKTTSTRMKNTANSITTCHSLCKFFILLCISTMVLFLILAAAVFYGAHHVLNVVGEQVVPRITVDHPIPLPPPVILTDSELHALKRRLHNFHHALHHDDKTQDLILTEHEINGLICDSDNSDDEELCDHVYVTISKNKVSADFSVPAKDAPGGKGRYFVGTKSLVVIPNKDHEKKSYSVEGAVVTRLPNDKNDDLTIYNITSTINLLNDDVGLDVRITALQVLGWMATDTFVNQFFDGTNFAKDKMCPHAKEALKRIDGISIGDDKIVVHVIGGRDEYEKEGETRMLLRN